METRWIRRRQSLAAVLALAAAALVPWTVWLAVRLPSRHVSPHWDVAWVGFDVALTTAIALTGVALWRRSRLTPIAAAAAGTLLLVDAWFDVVTSRRGSELEWAIAGAVLAELPMAALCFWLARRAIERARSPMAALDGEDVGEPRGDLLELPVEHRLDAEDKSAV